MMSIRFFSSGIGLFMVLISSSGCDGCARSNKENEALASVELGLSLERDGKMSDAAEAYRKAILINAECREAHFQLASLSERMGAFQQAETSYRRAISIRPDAAAYNNLGNVLGAQGRLHEAMDAYREALRLEPDLASAHYNLGHGLILARRLNEAETELATAYRLAPGEARYSAALGMFYANNGQPDRALPYLENCTRLDSSIGERMFTLADVYESLGRYDDAIRALERHLPTISDREKIGLLKIRVRELRMRRTDSKKRPLRS